MENILGFIAGPLGKFLYFIYENIAFESYGLAIILFTIIIKSVLMPLTFKQLKSSAKMQELQPKMKELQQKYKNDKQRLNEELLKFYKENNYNPASGWLPLLVQFPILISLYWTIIRPLQYMFGKSKQDVTDIANLINGFIEKGADKIKINSLSVQIDVINYFHDNMDKLSNSKVAKLISENEIINMDFLGINLSLKPKIGTEYLFGDQAAHYWGLLVIPLIAVLMTYFSSKLSMSISAANKDKGKQKDQATQMMGMMVYLAPLMTLFFAFSFPVGLALYWAVSSAFQIVQQIIVNRYKTAKKEVLVSK